jgi:hypothetical protein
MFSRYSLVRHSQIDVGKPDGGSSQNSRFLFFYASEDAPSAVEVTGYFNARKSDLTQGSIILAMLNLAVTPVLKRYRVIATMPDVVISPLSGTEPVWLRMDASRWLRMDGGAWNRMENA